MSNPIKSVLVTGGAGIIGSHISQECVRQGFRVRILDNLSTGKMSRIASFKDKVEFIQGDIRNIDDCRRALQGVDAVSHHAALRSVPKSVDSPVESHAANATGTLNMLVASRETGVRRFVYASSSSVYGDSRQFPQKESAAPAPVSPYAASKLAGENYAVLFCKTFSLETVSLRYFNVFGPRQDPESLYSAVIPRFMEQAFKGEPLELHWDGKQSRDFTHVANVVSANLLAFQARTGTGRTYNIANGKTTSLNTLIAAIEKIIGRKLSRIHHPKRKGDVRKTWADIGLARRVLGYKPSVALDPGLRETWDYFVEGYFKSSPETRHPQTISR